MDPLFSFIWGLMGLTVVGMSDTFSWLWKFLVHFPFFLILCMIFFLNCMKKLASSPLS